MSLYRYVSPLLDKRQTLEFGVDPVVSQTAIPFVPTRLNSRMRLIASETENGSFLRKVSARLLHYIDARSASASSKREYRSFAKLRESARTFRES